MRMDNNTALVLIVVIWCIMFILSTGSPDVLDGVANLINDKGCGE